MPTQKCLIDENCLEETSKTCLLCKKPFCDEHASALEPEDAEHCSECLNDSSTEFKESTPLIDEEGVSHDGRLLIPIGKTVTSCKAVSEMSDNELDKFIEIYARHIRDAEHMSDYYRTVHGMATMERTERGRAKAREKRGLRWAPSPGAKAKSVIPGSNGSTAAKKPDLSALADLFAKAGITAEMLKGVKK